MRFYGKVGFSNVVNAGNGVWKESDEPVERYYYGDVLRDSWSTRAGKSINNDLTISNQISILADDYFLRNLHSVLYVEYCGTKWCVTSVDPERPRLILSLGEVYNG